MKHKDIALIIIIAFISAVISWLASKQIFVPPTNRQQQVEVVQPISANFSEPDTRYFNNEANDPTKLITIGQNTNNDPFSSPSQ